jgi:hypothetical protein
LKKSNQENDHPVCWLALPHEGHSCLNRDFLCMTQKPTNLIVLQVQKRRDAPQFKGIDHPSSLHPIVQGQHNPLLIRHPPDMKRIFYRPVLSLGRPPGQSPTKWIGFHMSALRK